jgi:hypothetical protein
VVAEAADRVGHEQGRVIAQRDRASALHLAFALGGAHHGTAKAAANGADALLLDDGRLAVLDFGAVAEGSPARARLAADALQALRDEDPDAWDAALAALQGLPAAERENARAMAAQALGPFAGPGAQRLDGDAVLALGDRLGALPGLARVLIQATPEPGDLGPMRGAGEALATIARAPGASADWLAIAVAALRDGWGAAAEIERFLD